MYVSQAQKQAIKSMYLMKKELRFCQALIKATISNTPIHTDTANMLIVNGLIQSAPGKRKIFVLSDKGQQLAKAMLKEK